MKMWFVVGLLFCSIGISCKHQESESKGKMDHLPAFRLLSVNTGEVMNSQNLSPGAIRLFLYFSPDCEHCQREVQAIKKNGDRFMHVQLFLVTEDSLPETRYFARIFGLDTLSNCFVGKDIDYSFYKAFLPQSTPYVAIYGEENTLKRIYSGETNIQSILRTISEQ